MNRRYLSLLVIISIIFAIGTWHCKKSQKYAAEIAIIDQFCKRTDSLTEELDLSNNRVGLGKAIVEYIRDYKRLKPDFDKLIDRYPDIRILEGEKNAPPELKPHFKKVAKSMARLRAVLAGKSSRYARDKNLMKIVFELKEVMYYY